ncbi:MAG: hypothetical protein GY827_01510 [Cytophagales bacterium]|nr:hypothetical protein [Cytophagales bacterium]
MMDELKQKRVEKLAEEGFAKLREGEFEEALAISDELQVARYSAAFDIGAQAYVGLCKLDEAVDLLQKGLMHAPQAWPNWQLLGNILSDLNKFEQANNAYESALKCNDVWDESIYLNQAILSNRTNKYAEAINILKKIESDELHLHKIETNISAFIGLNMLDDAAALANQTLSIEEYPEEDEEVIGRIAAQLGKVYLTQGKSNKEVKEFALHSLSYSSCNGMLLALIRDIDNKYSDNANYYRVLIHCIVPATSPDYEDVKGYYCNYDVIAETTDELLKFICEFENDVVQDGTFIIDEIEILEENSKDPHGVYYRSGRAFYEE